MPGYMEGYGAGEEQRSRTIKRVLLIGIPAILLSVAAFFYFRTWSQERTVSRFIATLEEKKYDDAYKMWCTPEHPCRYYPVEKFKEDWGPEGQYKDLNQLKFGSVDYCGAGVVFEASYPNTKPFGLWVERSSNLISFAPYERCPGKHLQLGAFFKRLWG